MPDAATKDAKETRISELEIRLKAAIEARAVALENRIAIVCTMIAQQLVMQGRYGVYGASTRDGLNESRSNLRAEIRSLIGDLVDMMEARSGNQP